MTETIAVLDRVSYLYPRSVEPVLRDISFEIRKGEFLGLIGPTGAGKTWATSRSNCWDCPWKTW